MYTKPGKAMRYGWIIGGILAWLVGCGPQQSAEQTTPGEAPLPEGRLAVEAPVVYTAAAGDSAVVTLRIANGTAEADTLVGAEAPAVTRTVVLRALVGDTVQTSQPAARIVLPARSRVTVQLVLRNVQQALTPGQVVLVDLSLARQGRLRVRVPVEQANAEALPM